MQLWILGDLHAMLDAAKTVMEKELKIVSIAESVILLNNLFKISNVLSLGNVKMVFLELKFI